MKKSCFFRAGLFSDYLYLHRQRIFAAFDGVFGIDSGGPGHVSADACVGGVGVDNGFGAEGELMVVHGVAKVGNGVVEREPLSYIW